MRTKERIEKLESAVRALSEVCKLLKEGFLNNDQMIANLRDIRTLDHGTDEEKQAVAEKQDVTMQAEIDKLEAENKKALEHMWQASEQLASLSSEW